MIKGILFFILAVMVLGYLYIRYEDISTNGFVFLVLVGVILGWSGIGSLKSETRNRK